MNKTQRWISRGLICLFATASVLTADDVNIRETYLNWPKVTQENKPWTYWWWMGSAVDKPNLTKLLEQYHKAGLGGVHIIPIYGVKGYEARFINYLSPQWMEMLAHTIKEAKRWEMGVDMTTGTGWPFGGAPVGDEDTASKVILHNYVLEAGMRLGETVPKNTLSVLMAYSNNGEVIDLTERVDNNGVLDWVAPAGKWELYVVSHIWTGQKVKRAAPGGKGKVLDPFSVASLRKYLKWFDNVFAGYEGNLPRGQCHDSYEYYRANWTDDFFGKFQSYRGYDLRKQLPALLGKDSNDTVARVKCDYRATVAQLHLEYIEAWVKWCHTHGCLARNQAHGSPGNLLDLYGAADIPETEIFGSTGFDIPGLRVDPDFDNAAPDPLMLKFASSAAHVTGKTLVSSESCTWLGEHFRVAPAQVKPEIDQLLISGINHVFFHGMAYSPLNEAWPGWLFYASTNFAPSNSFWRDFPELNAYIARCQSILQSGRPDNDILLYFPIYDIWHNKGGMLLPLQVHNINKWFYGSPFHRVAKTLWDSGYTFDYVSDRQLIDAKSSAGGILMSGLKYRAVVVPECRFMPLRTLGVLMNLAGRGATIIMLGKLPAYAGPAPARGESERLSISHRLAGIVNSYMIELPAYAGPAPARGESERLSISHRLAGIANSYTIELPAYAGPAPARGESERLSISHRLAGIANSYTIELPAYAGPAPARGESERLSISPRLAGITNSYMIKLPYDVPGLGALEQRRGLFKTLIAGLSINAEHSGVSQASIGKGRFLIGKNIERMFNLARVSREPVVDAGIRFIRRTHEHGHHYFLTNLGREYMNDWISLAVEAQSVVIFDPRSSRRGLAAIRKGKNGVREIYLQLQPGESCILRTFTTRRVEGLPWRYLQASGRPHEIKGTWKVTFLEGGPELPAGFETNSLASWTELGGAQTKAFSGTARYTITFDKPAGNVDDWVLDLGRVCESGRIRINGRYAGTLWSYPFRIPVGEFLCEGQNVLEVEVTNLTANRIADMDRRKVPWKKFYDINFVSIKYAKFDASGWPPMDSGLLGPVQLIPSTLIGHKAKEKM